MSAVCPQLAVPLQQSGSHGTLQGEANASDSEIRQSCGGPRDRDRSRRDPGRVHGGPTRAGNRLGRGGDGVGTIQKIDKDGRVVSVKGDRGNTVDIKVGPNVALDKLKVGQRVNAAYYQEVAVALHKPGEQAPKMTQTVTERGGITAQQTTVTAKVVAVDLATNNVVLRGPQGETHAVSVKDPDLQAQLGKIKAGDSVDVTYTQAVAVSVEPMK